MMQVVKERARKRWKKVSFDSKTLNQRVSTKVSQHHFESKSSKKVSQHTLTKERVSSPL